MSYTAKVINAMIASPGDVEEERETIRRVIYDWNAINSVSQRIVLLPLGWESHSSPEMGATPQKIINKQVLPKGDFLVGIFGTRIGIPTEKYLSGTIEEIEKYCESGKLTMLYFSEKKEKINDIDLEQVKKLREFQKSCQSKGLYEKYTTTDDLYLKFSRNLQLKINENNLFKNVIGENSENIHLSEDISHSLNNDSKLLLKQVSFDKYGIILFTDDFNTFNIQTNEKTINKSSDHREEVRWESAINNLLDKGLIIKKKDNIFEITEKGYSVADSI